MAKVKKQVKTGDKKYPLKFMVGGKWFKVPEQKEFGDYCKKHGCSVSAVTLALQRYGLTFSPDVVAKWAKAHLTGYNGSKLGVYGCAVLINKVVGKRASWHSITGKNKKHAVKKMRACIKKGGFVIIEQGDPIHTVTIVGSRTGGTWYAHHGRLVKTTISKEYDKALKGTSGTENQNIWYKNRKGGAGYVCVL